MSEPQVMRCYRHPDRETMVSCSECGRPICPDCMVFAPVGIRCPDHAGIARGPAANVRRAAKRSPLGGLDAPVVTVLIIANVLIYMLQQSSEWAYIHGALFVDQVDPQGNLVGLAHGEWWRLLTSEFLHANLLHIGSNMLVLWFIRGLEGYLGSVRFLMIYLVSALAGSAGALVLSPDAVTVGASGAIFGMFGAMLVLEQIRAPGQVGPALTMIVLNMMIPFIYPSLNISIGGHVGGLVGGVLCALALSRFGRGHAAFGRLGVTGTLGIVAVGVLSVAVAYWRAKGVA